MISQHVIQRAHWEKISQIDRDFSTTLSIELITALKAEHMRADKSWDINILNLIY